jgi:hypothetical protein
VLHSVFVSTDALTSRWRKSWFKKHPDWNPVGTWLGWLLTFHLVALALLFWRARSVSDATSFLRNMLTGLGRESAGLGQLDYQTRHSLFLGLAGCLILELCERYRPERWLRDMYENGPRFVRWSIYGSTAIIMLFGIALLVASGGGSKNPFAYAIF